LSSDRHEVLKAWIAAILWLIVIAIESSALLSANNTSRILYPILHFLFGLDWEQFYHWHFYIRKTGHVIGYAILSILLFRAWRATLPAMSNVRWTPRWATIAVLGTAFVASLDEWHQSFIPSRTGAVSDVVLDTCAGIGAQILVFLWWKRFGKSTNGFARGATGLGKGATSVRPSEANSDANNDTGFRR
jgi:VanZ family protein